MKTFLSALLVFTTPPLTSLPFRIFSLFISFLLGALLSGCIGNSQQAANGFGGTGIEVTNGFGGTGITQARITNLGVDGINDSMTVKGIQYNTESATFIRDGAATDEQSDFNLGEIVTIEGTIDPDGNLGVASRVTFDDTLEGPITSVAVGLMIEVLGQSVETDAQTVFHGFDNLIDLRKGHVVEISGFVNDEQHILATSIRLLATNLTAASSILRIEGHITDVNVSKLTFNLNNLVVDYSNAIFDEFDAEDLVDGFYVGVLSSLPLSNDILLATNIVILAAGELEPNTFQELDGFITHFSSFADFDLDGIAVVSSSQTTLVRSAGFDSSFNNDIDTVLALSKHLIVRGFTNRKGVLVADEIIVISPASEIFIEAPIESINPAKQTVSLLGIEVTLDSLTYITEEDLNKANTEISLNQFSVGDFVFVEAYRLSNDSFTALQLSKIPSFDTVVISGTVVESDEESGVIFLFSHRIETTSEAKYFDVFTQPISKQAFFSELAKGESFIDVTGVQLEGSSIQASHLLISANQ